MIFFILVLSAGLSHKLHLFIELIRVVIVLCHVIHIILLLRVQLRKLTYCGSATNIRSRALHHCGCLTGIVFRLVRIAEAAGLGIHEGLLPGSASHLELLQDVCVGDFGSRLGQH